jgi:hypothetical protein
MNRKVGVWIDHERAVIVVAGLAGAKTVVSDLGVHTRFTRGTAGGSDSSRSGESERRFEERYRQQLDQYYDEVIEQLGDAEALFILGPGEAKTQLKERLGHLRTRPRPAVEVETADKLTESQLVAKIEEHFLT